MSIISYGISDSSVSQRLNSTSMIYVWQMGVEVDEHLFALLFTNGIILTTAFMTVISSALLLLFSLWRHNHNMQTNAVKDVSMDAHVKAIKSVLALFFINSINLTTFILILIYTVKNQIVSTFLVLIFQCALPLVHSFVLIFSNPNLEKSLLRTLFWVKRKLCMG
ncbi:PREDICTED: taste receptor type 2 member 140-like [Merops nubicus]|uniref:taste receptor type 2 member 140-like n=1 Tax=Merops nubicus TaxID=57421 RepID=UPI0004F063B3|nr:PREDICTED: taste receptor type 2 member 140-like [Merops nubicus]